MNHSCCASKAWRSKSELLNRMRQQSRVAVHDPLLEERQKREEWTAFLAARAAIDVSRVEDAQTQLSLFREHLRATLEVGRCYALRGCLKPGSWAVFRVVNVNPGSLMTMQRASFLAKDALWPPWQIHGLTFDA